MTTRTPSLAQQIKALTATVVALAARVDRMDQHRAPEGVTPVDTTDLSRILAYGPRTIRLFVIIYYSLFGALYTSVALAFAMLLPVPWRVIAGLAYLAVGIGNVSCIWSSRTAYATASQIRTAIPTIAAAGLILILNSIQDVRTNHISSLISAVIVWGSVLSGHVAWALSIAGRERYFQFTRALLAASQDRDHESQAAP